MGQGDIVIIMIIIILGVDKTTKPVSRWSYEQRKREKAKGKINRRNLLHTFSKI